MIHRSVAGTRIFDYYLPGDRMKTIGLIGGMSWESTAEYYRIINRYISRRLGGTHSAKIWLYSFDFQEIEELQSKGDWEELGRMMAEAALKLERAGADVLGICTNTMHRLVPDVESTVRIPILHIADATGEAVRNAGIDTVGLLGTEYTMIGDFIRGRLRDRFAIEVLIPEGEDITTVNDVIFRELVKGRFSDPSRKEYIKIIDKLLCRGAGGVILGCTEIPLLVRQRDVEAPLFDTTQIHAEALARSALARQ